MISSYAVGRGERGELAWKTQKIARFARLSVSEPLYG